MAAADKFTFVSPPVPKPLPVLREIFTQGDPLASGIAGGTHVYIDATYTGKINAVSFGGVDAPIQYVRDSTGAIVDWYVLAPKHPAGTVHVQVTDDNGTSLPTVADKFRYYPPPVVTGLSVTSGPARGGTNVTVLGSFHGPCGSPSTAVALWPPYRRAPRPLSSRSRPFMPPAEWCTYR